MDHYPNTAISFEKRQFVMRGLYTTDIMFKRWQRQNAFYELGLLQTIRAYKRRGTYVDIGANLGNHSIFFANFCLATSLVAVEAHPAIYAVLLKNLASNVPGKVICTTENKAVLDKDGNTVAVGIIDPKNVGGTKVTDKGATTVQTITVDTLVRDKNKIAVIKMDIEGCERRALLGAIDTIEKHKPLVAMEASNAAEFRQLNTVMDSLGYKTVFKTDKKPASYLWVPRG